MKIINILRLMMAALLAIGACSAMFVGAMPEATEQQELRTGGVAVKSDSIVALTSSVANATMAVDSARGRLLAEGTTQADDKQNVGTIVKQIFAIVQAKKQLKEVVAKEIEEPTQETYLSRIIAGAKKVGAAIAAPFKAGYGYTDEEKEVARETIAMLAAQQDKITQMYSDLNSAKKIMTSEQAQLKNRYEAIIAQFNNAIYQQQLITGDATSMQKKLLIGTAVAAGAAAGLALAKMYLDVKSEGTPQQPAEAPVQPDETLVNPVKNGIPLTLANTASTEATTPAVSQDVQPGMVVGGQEEQPTEQQNLTVPTDTESNETELNATESTGDVGTTGTEETSGQPADEVNNVVVEENKNQDNQSTSSETSETNNDVAPITIEENKEDATGTESTVGRENQGLLGRFKDDVTKFKDNVIKFKDKTTDLVDQAIDKATDLRDKTIDLRDQAIDKATDLRDQAIDLRDQAIDKAKSVVETVSQLTRQPEAKKGETESTVTEPGMGSVNEPTNSETPELVVPTSLESTEVPGGLMEPKSTESTLEQNNDEENEPIVTQESTETILIETKILAEDEAARAEAAKIEQEKLEQEAKDEVARAEAAKIEQEKLEQEAKNEVARAEAAKIEQEKLEQEAKDEVARAEAAKIEQEKLEQEAKDEVARAEAAKIEQEKLEQEAKDEVARAEAAKIEQEKLEQDAKDEVARAEAAKIEQEKLEQDAKDEVARLATIQLKQEEIKEEAKDEVARVEAIQLEQEILDQEEGLTDELIAMQPEDGVEETGLVDTESMNTAPTIEENSSQKVGDELNGQAGLEQQELAEKEAALKIEFEQKLNKFVDDLAEVYSNRGIYPMSEHALLSAENILSHEDQMKKATMQKFNGLGSKGRKQGYEDLEKEMRRIQDDLNNIANIKKEKAAQKEAEVEQPEDAEDFEYPVEKGQSI